MHAPHWIVMLGTTLNVHGRCARVRITVHALTGMNLKSNQS
ncbi:hypothetical protein RISK_004052 [Rhodopirellula islandica]|uniref:Uncharacterized protein n=1 Tax=Rhodopirellula islandica TaxID=595434 RepID=A0A0J1BA95_RHOIS|nr:hypothetical protein RISK_004052 [Rhodopirellula islandica]